MQFLRLFSALLVGALFADASPAHYVDGDPIGSNSRATDDTGGFTAVRQNGVNLGQPAILVSLTGEELLTEFRVIVFGVAGENGGPYFDRFDYRLDIWKSVDYFAGRDAEFQIALGTPVGIELAPQGPASIVPKTTFGTAGVGGDNAATYDFRFDLTQLPSGGALQDIFDSPFAAGQWVFGFQSWHDTEIGGSLRVTGSTAPDGPLPLFSRDNVVPRGILGGQNPNEIVLYWGMSLAAVSHLPGDFNADAIVDIADYVVWRKGLGTVYDELEYEIWASNFGETLPNLISGDLKGEGIVNADGFPNWPTYASATESTVPEPASLVLLAGSSLILTLQWLNGRSVHTIRSKR